MTVSDDVLHQMASILEVESPHDICKLKKSVEAAFEEFEKEAANENIQENTRQAILKEMNTLLRKLEGTHKQFRVARPEVISLVAKTRNASPIDSLKELLTAMRAAKGQIARPGRPRIPRSYHNLIERLWIVYGKATRTIDDDGKEHFTLGTRITDRETDQPNSRFHRFAALALKTCRRHPPNTDELIKQHSSRVATQRNQRQRIKNRSPETEEEVHARLLEFITTRWRP